MKFVLMILSSFCLSVGACAIANQAGSKITEANENQNSENSLANNSTSDNGVVREEHDAKKTPMQQNIRSIDFKNFTFNWFPIYAGSKVIKKTIVLRDGENEEVHISGPGIKPTGDVYQEFLANVSYADLTGDGKEEAVVTVAVSFYRSVRRCIFIFGETNKKAILLWQYETDIAGKNLDWRGHKVIEGELIIEEYDTKFGDPPICCPQRFFRKTFAWNGKTFEEKSTEIVPYNKNSREFTGYPSAAEQ